MATTSPSNSDPSKYTFILKVGKKTYNNAKLIKTTAIVGGIATGAILAPLAVVGAVGALGFGAAGVAAGSVAAGIQSAVYGGAVASGSIFAICQSIGAAGLGALGVASSATVGATTGGIIGGVASRNVKSSSGEIKIMVTGTIGKVPSRYMKKLIDSLARNTDKSIFLYLMEESLLELSKFVIEMKKDIHFDREEQIVDGKVPYKDADVILLFDETEDKEKNISIFKAHGQAIDQYAKKTVKVIIIGSKMYYEDNCKTCSGFAPSIAKENFTAILFINSLKVLRLKHLI